MIIGIGSDIININRIERVLERYGDRFIKRIFTPVEKEKSEKRISRVESYAKRFAAKEACAKALGTGFRKGHSPDEERRQERTAAAALEEVFLTERP